MDFGSTETTLLITGYLAGVGSTLWLFKRFIDSAKSLEQLRSSLRPPWKRKGHSHEQDDRLSSDRLSRDDLPTFDELRQPRSGDQASPESDRSKRGR